MDIPLNAKVSCLDGPCGQSTYLVLMPTNEEITHVVVRDDFFPETEYLVPIDRIAESTPRINSLNCNREELSKLPIFKQMEFFPSDSQETYTRLVPVLAVCSPGIRTVLLLKTSTSLSMSLLFGEEPGLRLPTAV